ncbi:MAG: hypothetical protein STSR0008_09430 [Ignavibacterium sp.]
MKKYKFLFLLLIPIIFISCNDDNNIVQPDSEPPSIPTGLIVINGDYRADLFWDENTERDLEGYNIYSSDAYDGRYILIATIKNNYFTDFDIENGVKYFYAVTAFDRSGNESELSYEYAYAVPRPEGFNEIIYDYRNYPNSSGYYFAENLVVPYNTDSTDFFFENFEGTFYLDVWDDTDIQDMGATENIYDIPQAPDNGWSSTKDAIAIVGHTYVIWTWDNHFAKIRVNNITPERIVFDWAYQTVPGEILLKPKIIKRDSLQRIMR